MLLDWATKQFYWSIDVLSLSLQKSLNESLNESLNKSLNEILKESLQKSLKKSLSEELGWHRIQTWRSDPETEFGWK